MKILFLPADKFGCGYYRMLLPASILKERGIEVEVAYSLNRKGDERIEWADVVVVQRQYWVDILNEIIKPAQERGKLIVYELDDNLLNVHPTSPAYKTFKKNSLEYCGLIKWFEFCDYFTVSTKTLKELFRNYGQTEVIPNSIDCQLFKRVKNKLKKIRIGWFGSSTHQLDLEILKDVIPEISRRYEVEWVFYGWCPEYLQATEFHKWTNIWEHSFKLSSLKLDIGLVPISDISFNTYKSNLKWLEYSACGIPTIASKLYEYADSIENYKTGILVKNRFQDWVKALERLITNSSLRKEIGENAKTKVNQDYDIRKNIGRWTECYQRFLDSRGN